MATKRINPNTNGTAFNGTQYTEALANRGAAMKAFENGEINATQKNAARAAVRQMRNAITKTGMSVTEWRESEEIREAEIKANRKPRARKTPQAEPVTTQS